MAEPRSSNVELEDVSDILQTQYFDKFYEQTTSPFSLVTNRLFKTASEEITGDGKTLQVEVRRGDTVRFGNDPMGAFPSPSSFKPAKMTVRWNKQSTSAHDFSDIKASAQTNFWDMEEEGKGSAVDFVERIYNQVMPQYEAGLAVHRHIGRTARLALVSATPKQNNKDLLSEATATPTNTTGVRFSVDNGSIAYFFPGMRISVYQPQASGGALRAGNLNVTDVNPVDSSVGAEFITSGITGHISTGNVANIADNDEVYLSGERDMGMYSFGAYFTHPATGDSFIGGKDRNDTDFRWLVPTMLRRTDSSAVITRAMFHQLGQVMGYRQETEQGGVFMACPEVVDKVRIELGEAAFFELPSGDSRMKRFAHFGNVGLLYQHPTFGVVQITADPLCHQNKVLFFSPDSWRSFYYGHKGLKPVKDGGQHWYRLNDTTPNTGRGLVMKADWVAAQMDFCFQPWKNGAILNISAA